MSTSERISVSLILFIVSSVLLFVITHDYSFVNKDLWPWNQISNLIDVASGFLFYAIPIVLGIFIICSIYNSLSDHAELVALREAQRAKEFSNSWFKQLQAKISTIESSIIEFEREQKAQIYQLEKRIQELTAIKSAVNDNELERLI